MRWREFGSRLGVLAQQALVHTVRGIARAASWSGRTLRRAWQSKFRRRLLRPALVTARVFAIAAVLAGATVLAGSTFVRRVSPTDHVVRQNNWGADAGVQMSDLAPGFHRGVPGGTSWHVIDARTSFLRFGAEGEANALPPLAFPPLELRTADDLELSLSVSVPFRIQEGQAHRVVADGLKSTYKQNAKTAVEKVLLERFASLRSEEWFLTERRDAVAKDALKAINTALDRIHCVAEAVLVNGATFPALYEEKLAEQKLNSQKLQTDKLFAKRDLQKHLLDVEQAAVSRAEADLSATFDLSLERAKIELEGQIQAITTAADTYRNEQRIVAENAFAKSVATGQLAVDQADALKERLTNEALESTGGRLLLAQEAAGALHFKSVRIDSSGPNAPNVFDLDSFVALLMGKNDAGR
jgi:hypothetical protein